MKKNLYAAMLLLGTLLTGCASGPGGVPPLQGEGGSGSDVAGPRWNLLLLGTSERWAGGSETPWFEIDANGRLSGTNGCNRLMGEASFPGNQRIEIQGLASTRMACPDSRNSQRVNQMLENAYRYLIDHDRLVLFGPDSRVLGGFRREQ